MTSDDDLTALRLVDDPTVKDVFAEFCTGPNFVHGNLHMTGGIEIAKPLELRRHIREALKLGGGQAPLGWGGSEAGRRSWPVRLVWPKVLQRDLELVNDRYGTPSPGPDLNIEKICFHRIEIR